MQCKIMNETKADPAFLFGKRNKLKNSRKAKERHRESAIQEGLRQTLASYSDDNS